MNGPDEAGEDDAWLNAQVPSVDGRGAWVRSTVAGARQRAFRRHHTHPWLLGALLCVAGAAFLVLRLPAEPNAARASALALDDAWGLSSPGIRDPALDDLTDDGATENSERYRDWPRI